MLELVIPETEAYSETEGIITLPEETVVLEHSLVSISKWESKFHKPFLTSESPSDDELKAYIMEMIISHERGKKLLVDRMSAKNMESIGKYIRNPSTAYKFPENTSATKQARAKNPWITSDLIYYWMVVNNIPKECERWHIERLLTLIRICATKAEQSSSTSTKSKKDLREEYRLLNEKRLAEFGGNG